MLLRRLLIGTGIAAGLSVLAVIGFLIAALQGLPSLQEVQNYQPPITTRVHAGDGALVAEFADEHRMFVPITAIPERVQNAFVAVEDARFFEHSGIDYQGLARAVLRIPYDLIRGRRPQGASTITQQVAGNILTGRASSCGGGLSGVFCQVWTKIREGLVAQRIEKAFPGDSGKRRILELYLNQIYLGNRAYGVAAASLNYFNKPLSELTIAEAAYLAALPKGPANYHPTRRHDAAVQRRNFVIGRMRARGYIADEEATAAQAEDLVTTDRLSGDQYVAAAHFVEELRRQVLAQYGERDLLRGGLSIRSTLDTRMQLAAAQALRAGLERYDRSRAWRGPLGAGDPAGDIQAQLQEAAGAPRLSNWRRAMVTATQGGVRVTDDQGDTGRLNNDDVQWAAQGARRDADRALKAGSIIYVQRGSNDRYALKQAPRIQGALVAMDPHTGRVLAMVGGYSFPDVGFNRATQAWRQPGSSFKPVVYAAALDWTEGGFPITPATLIDDGPLAIEAGDGSVWSPENYTREFFGPTTLRRGLELSRNAMTARMTYEMGPERVLDYARRLQIYQDGDRNQAQAVYSLALGAEVTTVLRMTSAYGVFVNGGRQIQPTLIDRIQDRNGHTVFARDQRTCEGCSADWNGQAPPMLADAREQVLDPVTAYQIVSMAEGVVQRGTGTVVNSLGIPLGGKTGTTDDYRNAWFVGFSPDLVAGVWVGFDDNSEMGEGATGATLAAPIFRDFMGEALKDVPPVPFRIPPGVRLARIDYLTGLLPGSDSQTTILEAFRPGTEPQRQQESSPFVFGGTAPIDPRVVSGFGFGGPPPASGEAPNAGMADVPLTGAGAPTAGAQPQQPRDPGSEDLGGLY